MRGASLLNRREDIFGRIAAEWLYFYWEQMATICFVDQWFKRCNLKTFWWPLFFGGVELFCAILVEGIMRNNSVKLFRNWTSSSGGDVI